jgi:hypothetical protein
MGAMFGNTIKCNVCGAAMVPQPDGRTYACQYCNARVQVAIEAEQIAAGLRLDFTNAAALLAQLAGMLTSGFAAQTRIEGHGAEVHLIEVTLEKDVFVAQRESHGVTAKHKKVVRGVALKTKACEIDEWVDLLTQALAKHANSSARATEVLAQLSGRVR